MGYYNGTRERTRTSMFQGTLAPEASASTIPPLAHSSKSTHETFKTQV
jgi:hypothetical protein